MENLINLLIETLNEELDSLNNGHSFDKDRIARMRRLISLFVYLEYAKLNDKDMMKLFEMYNHYV